MDTGGCSGSKGSICCVNELKWLTRQGTMFKAKYFCYLSHASLLLALAIASILYSYIKKAPGHFINIRSVRSQQHITDQILLDFIQIF